jgi:hypothetical protein
MEKKNNYNYLIISGIISTFIFLNLFLRFSNSNLGFLDFGTEIFNSKKIFESNYEYFFKGHIKLVQIFLLPIFYIENIFFIFTFFIFLKSLIIFLFINFFLKSKLNFLFIIFCPILWIISMFDFHYDIFFLPLYILASELSKKNKNFYFLTLFFGIIKEHFFIIPLLTSFYLIFKKELKIGLALLVFTIFFSVLFYYYLFNFGHNGSFDLQTIQRYFGINQFLTDLKATTSYFLVFLENLIFFVPIIIYIFFFNRKITFHLFIFLGLLFIFLPLSFIHKLNIFSHYYIPFLPPLFYLLINYQINKKFALIIFLFIYNFIFSASPLSFWFWSNKYKYYNYKSMLSSYETRDFQDYIKKINLTSSNIIIQNNFFNQYFLNSNTIDIFPKPKLAENTLVVINLNKEKFLYDQKCKKMSECDQYYNLEYLMSNIYVGFELVYSRNNIYILSNINKSNFNNGR